MGDSPRGWRGGRRGVLPVPRRQGRPAPSLAVYGRRPGATEQTLWLEKAPRRPGSTLHPQNGEWEQTLIWLMRSLPSETGRRQRRGRSHTARVHLSDYDGYDDPAGVYVRRVSFPLESNFPFRHRAWQQRRRYRWHRHRHCAWTWWWEVAAVRQRWQRGARRGDIWAQRGGQNGSVGAVLAWQPRS